MTPTILERSDGVRVSIQHAGSAAHAVYISSSDGHFDGRTLYRAPGSFIPHDSVGGRGSPERTVEPYEKTVAWESPVLARAT